MPQNQPNTILIVDDDEFVRMSVVAYLEDSGFDVLQAACGEDAVQVIVDHKPEVVVCDLRMPDMDGIEVLKKVGELSLQIPIIMLSGMGVIGDVVQALRLGAADYIIKPVNDLEVLELSIKRSLEKSQLIRDNQKYRAQLELANKELSESLRLLEEDQEAGRVIQGKLLPATPLQIGQFEFSHFILPSLYLSGDFVYYFKVNEQIAGFFIADVSGHGASSAFITAMLRLFSNRMVSLYSDDVDVFPDAADFMKRLNIELLELQLGKHVTMVCGMLNLETRDLQYSVGGHFPSPILVADDQAIYMEGEGLPVGLFEKAEFTNHNIELSPEFAIVMLSDGVFEVLPGDSLEEKEKYLLSAIGKGLTNIEDLVSGLGVDRITDSPDDITLMVLKAIE